MNTIWRVMYLTININLILWMDVITTLLTFHQKCVMPSSMAPMALPPDRLAAIEATGRELVALAMRTHGALSQDKQRVRRLLRALWAVGLVLGLGFLHRRRRQIAASIRGGPRPRGDAPLLGVPASAALLGV